MSLSQHIDVGRIAQDPYSKVATAYNPGQMAVTMMQSGYMAQPRQQQQHQYTSYMATIPGPPSPPVEENSKCSLPSISSLLDIANDPSAVQQQQQQLQIQQIQQVQQVQQVQQQQLQQAVEYRIPTSTSRGLPPTPPMQTDIGYDGRQSPSSSSQYSVVSTPIAQANFYFPNNIDMHTQQQQQLRQQQVSRQRRLSYSSYAPQYTPLQSTSYYPPTIQSTPTNNLTNNALYYQRPLPNTYNPSNILSVPMQSFQHHHYAPTTAASSYTQSQDRYQCDVCFKKFSRPSSLSIHGRSHTGEKPHFCPHEGCDKAFSVRSNMKRHEKSCHLMKSRG